MSAPSSMWPIEDWLKANGIPRSTYYYLKKNHPEHVPQTVTIGKRRQYVTVKADAEYRARLNASHQAVGA